MYVILQNVIIIIIIISIKQNGFLRPNFFLRKIVRKNKLKLNKQLYPILWIKLQERFSVLNHFD